MNYMLMPLRRYADFEGRSRRKEFWMWALLNLIVSGILFGALIAMAVSAFNRVDERGGVRYESSSSYDRDRDRGSRYSDESDSEYSDRGSRYDDETDSGYSSSSRDRDRDRDRDFSSGYSYRSSMEMDPVMFAEEVGAIFWIIMVLWLLWSLFVFIPNLAVSIRRLHDTDKSGWMILIGLIPLVGAIVLFVFYLMEGTAGPNRFGPDPKGPAVDRTFA